MAKIKRYESDGMVLAIGRDRCAHYIAWVDISDGDEGARLLECGISTSEDRVIANVLREVDKAHDDVFLDDGVYMFESEKLAKSTLARLNAELTAARDKAPLPEWAKSAISAGWKPPRGWHP